MDISYFRRKVLMLMLFFLCVTLAIMTLKFSYNILKAHNGTTTEIVGTITDKQYIAAHTTTSGCLLFFSSDYHPDEYIFTLRRFDKDKKAWETAKVDVDKDTYNQYTKNEPYTDKSGKMAFFHVEDTSNSRAWLLG